MPKQSLSDITAYRIDGTRYSELKDDLVVLGEKIENSSDSFLAIDVSVTLYRDNGTESAGQFDSDFCKFVKINDIVFLMLDTYGVSIHVDSKLRPSGKNKGLEYVISDLIRETMVYDGVYIDSYGNTRHIYYVDRDDDIDKIREFLAISESFDIPHTLDTDEKLIYSLASVTDKRSSEYQKMLNKVNEGDVGDWLSENPFEDKVYEREAELQ
jgi:hypothetical protein